MEHLDQGFLRDERLAELPVEREIDGLRHDELLPRVIGDRPAERGPLVQENEGEARLLHGERRRDPGRPRADDRGVDLSGGQGREDGLEAAAELHPLSHGVLDQAHAAELPDDVNAGAARLEELVDFGQVEPPLARAEDELDGADGAFELAPGMADAIGRDDEGRPPVDDAQDVPLRADLDAREAPDAGVRVDDGMEGGREVKILRDRRPEDLRVPHLTPLATEEEQDEPQAHREERREEDDRVLQRRHLGAMSERRARTPRHGARIPCSRGRPEVVRPVTASRSPNSIWSTSRGPHGALPDPRHDPAGRASSVRRRHRRARTGPGSRRGLRLLSRAGPRLVSSRAGRNAARDLREPGRAAASPDLGRGRVLQHHRPAHGRHRVRSLRSSRAAPSRVSEAPLRRAGEPALSSSTRDA